MRNLAVILVLVFLGGCAKNLSHEEMEAHKTCIGYGLKYSGSKYSKCVMEEKMKPQFLEVISAPCCVIY